MGLWKGSGSCCHVYIKPLGILILARGFSERIFFDFGSICEGETRFLDVILLEVGEVNFRAGKHSQDR